MIKCYVVPNAGAGSLSGQLLAAVVVGPSTHQAREVVDSQHSANLLVSGCSAESVPAFLAVVPADPSGEYSGRDAIECRLTEN